MDINNLEPATEPVNNDLFMNPVSEDFDKPVVEDIEPAADDSQPPVESQPSEEPPAPVDDRAAEAAALAAMVTEPQKTSPAPVASAPEPAQAAAPSPEPEPQESRMIQFFNDDEFEDIVTDPKKLNEVLNRAVAVGYEYAMRAIPAAVSNNENIINAILQRSRSEQETTSLANEFYSTNEDLKPFADIVQKTYQEIEKIKPPQTVEDVRLLMDATAQAVRTRLGKFSGGSEPAKAPGGAKPGFIPGGGKPSARPQAPNLDQFAKDFDDVFKARNN